MPPLEVAPSRLESRQQVLQAVNRFAHKIEVQANRDANAFDTFQENAFNLMTSQATKQAFDINREPDSLRDEYGRHSLGQSCLMARRLVEAGVRCVMVDHINWDTHFHNFRILKDDLLPKLDSAISSLFRDLHYRGMLDSTLVLVTGEFGRTPKINKEAGRDHWGPSTTIAIGGGGVQGGTIVGASDEHAAKPATAPFEPADLAATLYHSFGIDPNTEFLTAEGRPIPLVPGEGRVMRELF